MSDRERQEKGLSDIDKERSDWEVEEFTIHVKGMKRRWVRQFLGMLKEMENFGKVGHSEEVRFFADGDGDFNPRFEWDTPTLPARPPQSGLWDAG